MPFRNGRAHALKELRELLARLPANEVRCAAGESIYADGALDDSLYVIDSGAVKLVMSSASGKDCLIAIYAVGEVFGESCFAGSGRRFETATAMHPSMLRRVARRDVVAELERTAGQEILLRHLADRIAERQTAVFDLVTLGAEHRLARILLTVAEKLGDPDGPWLRIDRIRQEELAQLVGTTRPRTNQFLQKFQRSGMLELPTRLTVRVHRAKMAEWLRQG